MFALVFGFAAEIYFPGSITGVEIEMFLNFLVIFLWIFVEPIFLSTIGTTPFKWLLKTSVRMKTGENITFGKALVRSFKVVLRGLGLGIPIVAFFTLLVAYRKLKDNGETSWDREGGFIVLHDDIGPMRGSIVVLIIFSIIAFIAYGYSL